MTARFDIRRVVFRNDTVLTVFLLVIAAICLAALAWLRMHGEEAGWFGRVDGTVLFAAANVLLFAALLWFKSRALQRVYAKLEHRERLYAVLSQVNQSIVQIADRERLFARVCEIAIEFGKFRMAWIGLADHAAGQVKPVAWAGLDEGFFEHVAFPLRDDATGQMPAVAAIRAGRSVICNRVQTDPRMAPLREEALKRGYRAAAAFPLRSNGDVLGSLVFYADEPDFFDADEVKLLEEVAGDLSFALKQMEREAQRRQIEREKVQLGAELRMIFDTVPAIIFYKDREHRIVRANAASLRAFGRPAEEIIGKTDAELGLPHAAQYARDEDEIAATGRPMLDIIEPFESPDGLRWLHTDKVPLRDESGAITGIIGLAVDVTERRRAEEALRESEADFRASFLSTAVGQVQADPITGRYLRVNPRFCEITGYREEELLGMTFRELTHPDDRTEDGAEHARLLRGEIPELVREKRYRRKNGSSVWVSIHATLIRDEAGRPQRTLAVVQDITARKAYEDALRVAESKARWLVEQSLVGIYVIQDGRFVYVNPKMSEMLGFSLQELTSRPVLEFIAEEDRAVAAENIRKRMEGVVESVRYELRMLRKDGSALHADVHGGRVEYGDRPAILGTLLDVTEQRKLEDQLHQAQKMEAIGQLAGGIAHDFNNLLTAIVCNTRLALDDLPPGHPARVNIEEIDAASTRATELVRRILTFSRHQRPERKPVVLQPVLEEVLKLLRATLPATIEIRTDLATATPTILADATQVHQVMMNLATNACHAMNGRGVLEVGLVVIDLDAAQAGTLAQLREGRYLRASVRDTGCGMDSATLGRIFDPFFTTKPQGEGTGLGLSVVHGIMKGHDGAVIVYSQPGKGTVFHLYFPVHEGEVVPERPVVPGAVSGAGQRILFVDDEDAIRRAAVLMLTRLGYQVTPFSAAEEALTAFREAPENFDLVMSDLSMPGMTGLDFAREVLRVRPGLPVVIATGFVRADDEETGRDIGIRGMILKPYRIAEMAPVLSELLAESTRRDLHR